MPLNPIFPYKKLNTFPRASLYEIPDTAWVVGKLKISKLKNKHIFISISFFMVRRRTILEPVSGLVCFNTNFKTSNLCLNDQAYNCLIHFSSSLCIIHQASCIMHHASCIMHHASCIMHHATCMIV